MISVSYPEKREKQFEKMESMLSILQKDKRANRKKKWQVFRKQLLAIPGFCEYLTVGAPGVERGHCERIGPEKSNQR